MALLVLVATGCSPKRDTGEAQAAIAMFHSAYNRADYAQILDQAAGSMRSPGNAHKMTRLLRAVRTRLGPFETGKLGGWRVNYTPSGKVTSATYASSFRDGEASENFVFVEVDGAKRLAGYTINSDAFLRE
jgi:hypothetical protein